MQEIIVKGKPYVRYSSDGVLRDKEGEYLTYNELVNAICEGAVRKPNVRYAIRANETNSRLAILEVGNKWLDPMDDHPVINPGVLLAGVARGELRIEKEYF